jgi:hypothetical protein
MKNWSTKMKYFVMTAIVTVFLLADFGKIFRFLIIVLKELINFIKNKFKK